MGWQMSTQIIHTLSLSENTYWSGPVTFKTASMVFFFPFVVQPALGDPGENTLSFFFGGGGWDDTPVFLQP